MAYFLPLYDWIVHPSVHHKPSATPRLRSAVPTKLKFKHQSLTPWEHVIGQSFSQMYLMDVPLNQENRMLYRAAHWAQSHRVIPFIPLVPQTRQKHCLLSGYVILLSFAPLSSGVQHAIKVYLHAESLIPVEPAQIVPYLQSLPIHWPSSFPLSMPETVVATVLGHLVP
ncbi:hypothetical protein [Sulfobacillus thermosulfidooxidans]|uniref:hypothetical protein n=1 Tax=Sulfobacillus thermosulfidooxidans TaxID=28034 RepID=UPI0006B4FE22|nr:hypothetical protein [Sulfobacillus thermosulfidooxidans]